MENTISCKDFDLNIIRLGNKLFFYSFLIGVAKKYNKKIVLPEYFLWKYLKYPPLISNNIGDVKFTLPDDEYNSKIIDDFFKINNNNFIDVRPTSQTERVFENNKNDVYELLTFKDEIIEKIKEKNNHLFDKPTIGISIRLGSDMTNNSCFYKIPNDWYINSLNKYFSDWRENYNVVIFSDNINLSKEIFKDYDFKYADHNDSHNFIFGVDNSESGINHLILGSLMNNFIISQSTFSWWQAWLVKNNPNNVNGKIIHSGRNFDGEFLRLFKNKDYYPKNWVENKIN
jgi:hypothetical protein